MAKQSPKDPKFRCNICKEYYYAPEHLVHYQCPKHGYLCKEHIGQKGELIYGHDAFNNPNKKQDEAIDEQFDPYWDKVIELPNSIVGKCLCNPDENYMRDINYIIYNNHVNGLPYESIESVLENQNRCYKLPTKFLWSDKIKRWIEEGKEKEDDFVKENKIKMNSTFDQTEIKLLVELFEKNVLTKEQFLEQIKNKI